MSFCAETSTSNLGKSLRQGFMGRRFSINIELYARLSAVCVPGTPKK